MTNADAIRNMTDDELCVFIRKIYLAGKRGNGFDFCDYNLEMWISQKAQTARPSHSSEIPNNCETCRHKHDGTIGYCRTCGESNYEPKDELTKYRIVHSILQGQSGNEGVEYEILDGFTTYKEAQEQIATMPHNGWHNYKIEEVNESN
jgi:hypothetical protein